MKKRASIAKRKPAKALPPSICDASIVSDDLSLYDPLHSDDSLHFDELLHCDDSLLCNDSLNCDDLLLCNDSLNCDDSLLCNESLNCDDSCLCDAATTPTEARQSPDASIERNANSSLSSEQLPLLDEDWRDYDTKPAFSRRRKPKKRKARKQTTTTQSLTGADHGIHMLRTKAHTIVAHPDFAGVLLVSKCSDAWTLRIELDMQQLRYDGRVQAELYAIAAIKGMVGE